jgi:hypothetical protein
VTGADPAALSGDSGGNLSKMFRTGAELRVRCAFEATRRAGAAPALNRSPYRFRTGPQPVTSTSDDEEWS